MKLGFAWKRQTTGFAEMNIALDANEKFIPDSIIV